MMQIAVTGATGLLGRAIVETLAERGHSVAAIGRTPIGKRFQQVDLADATAVRQAIAEVDCVVHAAGKTGDQGDERENERMAEAIGAATQSGQFVVNLSSVAVYGDVPQRTIDETTACNPASSYGRSKLRSEQLLDQHAERTCHLRIGNVYREAHLASIAASQLQTLIRANDACNLVFVQDVADLVAHLVDRSDQPAVPVLNVVRPGLGALPFRRLVGPLGRRGLLHRYIPRNVGHAIRTVRGVPSLPNKIFTSSTVADSGFRYRPIAEVAPASWSELTRPK